MKNILYNLFANLCLFAGLLISNALAAPAYQECRGISSVDGDDVIDFLCADPSADDGGIDAGAVALFSGSSGSKIWELLGKVPNGHLGAVLRDLNDIDDDGVSDFAVSESSTRRTCARKLTLISGRTREVIKEISIKERTKNHSYCSYLPDLQIMPLARITKTSPARFAVGNALADEVRIYRGAKVVKTLKLPKNYYPYLDNRPESFGYRSSFGTVLGTGGDLDGDGMDDLLVGADSASLVPVVFPEGQDGVVFAFSGRSLKLIRAFALSPPRTKGRGNQIGALSPLSFVHDLTGDGIPEIVTTTRFPQGAVVLNGATGKVVRKLPLQSTDDGAQIECSRDYTLAQLGDRDGDGMDDLAFRSTTRNNFDHHSLGIISDHSLRAITTSRKVWCLSSAGDFDKDGFPDIIRSVPVEPDKEGEDPIPGGFSVISGKTLTELLRIK